MKREPILAALAALALVALAAAAVPPQPQVFCPPIDPQAAARPAAGLRAFRDPVTGRLRNPTAEEAVALAAAEAQAEPEQARVFEVVVHPDGMKTVDLRGAFAVAAVAVRNPDGTITIRCAPAGAPGVAHAPARLEQK